MCRFILQSFLNGQTFVRVFSSPSWYHKCDFDIPASRDLRHGPLVVMLVGSFLLNISIISRFIPQSSLNGQSFVRVFSSPS